MAKDFSRHGRQQCVFQPEHSTRCPIPARRTVLRGGLGALIGGLFAPLAVGSLAGCATMGMRGTGLGFKTVPISTADTIVVPEGLQLPGNCAVGRGRGPVGRKRRLQDGRQQHRRRAGNADGHAPRRHPLFSRRRAATPACWENHEYSDDGLLHADGMRPGQRRRCARRRPRMACR